MEKIPDLLWLLSGGAFVVLLINSDQPILLYPLAIASGLAVVALATLVNLLLLESRLGTRAPFTGPRDHRRMEHRAGPG